MVTYLTAAGRRNITGYSVQEDATPLDAASTEGGVGTISFALVASDDALMLYDTDIQLDDDFRGTTSGTITGVNVSGGLNKITADSRLGVLVGNTKASPITGSFEAVARYYLSLGQIVDGIYFDPALSGIHVTAQGWFGDAWLNLKQLAQAYNVEIALVSNKVVFRPIRFFETNIRRKTDFSIDVSKSDAAQAIEVTYYDNVWADRVLMYPRTPDEVASQQVYTVEAGAILEDDIQLTASLESVLQPICVDDVSQTYDGTFSVYSVRGSDNSLISAQDWTTFGGKIELSINDDTKSVHIKITASSDQYYGPYRIAGRVKEVVDPTTVIIGPGQTANTTPTNNLDPAQSEQDYASLRIVGTGTQINENILTLPTGASTARTATQTGVTVQNIYVSSIADAYRVGVYTASRYRGEEQTISGTLTQINQRSGSGSVLYPMIVNFDDTYAGKTIGQFNALWAGKTIADFNAVQEAGVIDTFDNQVFGNVSGARFRYKDAYYRITTSTVTESGISFTATRDTLIEEFNAAHVGKTIADFNAEFAGMTLKQFGRISLQGG